jgi:hypothetical protein
MSVFLRALLFFFLAVDFAFGIGALYEFLKGGSGGLDKWFHHLVGFVTNGTIVFAPEHDVHGQILILCVVLAGGTGTLWLALRLLQGKPASK